VEKVESRKCQSPSILVDRIIEWEPGFRVRGIKNVSHGERWFLGHFPGMPVMPGMLLVEAIAQMGQVLSRERAGKRTWLVTFLGDVKFTRPVCPGDQVILEVRITGSKENGFILEGSGTVNNERALQVGRMILVPRED
jgi:3-hydroxyacyl-[acyl-carrier-protein] dehydratase